MGNKKDNKMGKKMGEKKGKKMDEEFKLKDRVIDILNGWWGNVVDIKDGEKYPILVSFDNGVNTSYTKDGRLSLFDKRSRLFFDDIPPFVAPPRPKKPLPALKVDTKVIVWEEDGVKFPRFFKGWRGDKCLCFANGQNSFSTNGFDTDWKYWKIYENEENI